MAWESPHSRHQADWSGGRGKEIDEQQRKPGDKGRNPAGLQRFGSSPVEAAVQGERGFLAWADTRTLAHHVQDAAGFLHFLNICGILFFFS